MSCLLPVEIPSAPRVVPAVAAKPPAGSARDSRTRSLLKAVSWRIIGTLDTVAWAWIITGQLRISLVIGSAEALSKIVLFYLHERTWARVPVFATPAWWPGR